MLVPGVLNALGWLKILQVRSLDHTPVAGFTATVGSSIVVGPSSGSCYPPGPDKNALFQPMSEPILERFLDGDVTDSLTPDGAPPALWTPDCAPAPSSVLPVGAEVPVPPLPSAPEVPDVLTPFGDESPVLQSTLAAGVEEPSPAAPSRLSSAKAPTTLGEGRLLPQIEAATLPSLRVYSS
jgi:hypothetical protein